MIITTQGGATRPVQIGQALAGVRIVDVKITANDAAHPEFLNWFNNMVAPRFAMADSVREVP